VRTVRALVGVAVFLGLWEIAGRSRPAPPGLLPPPSVVLVRVVQLFGDRLFLIELRATMLAWLIVLVVATVAGTVIGLLLGSVPVLRAASQAVIEFLRPIPSVALIPLAAIVIGVNPGMKIALAIYAATWPVLFNTIYALGEVDPVQLETARAFGAGRLRTARAVALPSAAPFVLTGIRLSAAISLVVLVSVELTSAAVGGIGAFIFRSTLGDLRMDLVLAAVVVLGVIGYLANAVLEAVHRRWLSWGDAAGTGR
jgi:NitT/TauT family transport system permease protein